MGIASAAAWGYCSSMKNTLLFAFILVIVPALILYLTGCSGSPPGPDPTPDYPTFCMYDTDAGPMVQKDRCRVGYGCEVPGHVGTCLVVN